MYTYIYTPPAATCCFSPKPSATIFVRRSKRWGPHISSAVSTSSAFTPYMDSNSSQPPGRPPSLKLTAIAPENRKGNFHVPSINFQGASLPVSGMVAQIFQDTLVSWDSLQKLMTNHSDHSKGNHRAIDFCQQQRTSPRSSIQKLNLGCFHKTPSACEVHSILTNDPF